MINISYIIQTSIVAGAGIAAWAMMMHMLNFTTMSIISYIGCILIKKSSGPLCFATGMIMHFILSIGITFIYIWAIPYFNMSSIWYQGLFLGFIHWIVAGIILPLTDKINYCVTEGYIPPMKAFAYGYGISAVFTFFVGHLIYGLIVCKMLSL